MPSDSTGPLQVSTSRNTVPAATHSIALPPPPPLLLPLRLPLPVPLLLPFPPRLPPPVPLLQPPPLLELLKSVLAAPRLRCMPPSPPALLPPPPPLICHFRSIEYSSGALTHRMIISGVKTCPQNDEELLQMLGMYSLAAHSNQIAAWHSYM